MMDIKQQELDGAFLDGVIAADDAIMKVMRKHVSPFVYDEAAKAIYDMMVERLGKERLESVQGPKDRELRS